MGSLGPVNGFPQTGLGLAPWVSGPWGPSPGVPPLGLWLGPFLIGQGGTLLALGQVKRVFPGDLTRFGSHLFREFGRGSLVLRGIYTSVPTFELAWEWAQGIGLNSPLGYTGSGVNPSIGLYPGSGGTPWNPLSALFKVFPPGETRDAFKAGNVPGAFFFPVLIGPLLGTPGDFRWTPRKKAGIWRKLPGGRPPREGGLHPGRIYGAPRGVLKPRRRNTQHVCGENYIFESLGVRNKPYPRNPLQGVISRGNKRGF